MCSPTLAVAALMAVSKASEISQTNQAAEATQNAELDKKAILDQQRNLEAEGVKSEAANKLTQARRQSMRDFGTARAVGAGTGVRGASPLRNLSNIFMQESFTAGTIVGMQETNLAQIGVQSQADFLGARSAITAAENTKSTGLSAALQIGVAGLQGYSAAGGFAGGAGAGATASSTPVSTFNTYGTATTGSTTGGWLYGQKPMSGFNLH
jgi:hypothetical protein